MSPHAENTHDKAHSPEKGEKALTPHNQKILELLARAEKPLSAYDLLDKMRRHGVRSPPTVYRALADLVKRGLIHRIESLNAFVACHHEAGHDHMSQFAICTSCGNAEEIDDPAILRAAKKVGQKFLKQVDHRVLEISGICKDCAGS
jgi:Fur family zinc uptake transcriptional regulator